MESFITSNFKGNYTMPRFSHFIKIDEKATVSWMIQYYCRKKHGSSDLCEHCSALLNYAKERITKCPHGENKPVCSKCKIHCYKKDYREIIIEVMSFSGPQILLHRPLTGIKYLVKKKFFN